MILQELPTGLKVRQPGSGLVRIPFVRRCLVTGPLSRQEGLICNISTAGAYVRLHGELAAGTAIKISFEIFPGDPAVVVEAEVRWQNTEPRHIRELPPGCGLRFAQMSPGDEALVAALVKGYTVRPSEPPAQR